MKNLIKKILKERWNWESLDEAITVPEGELKKYLIHSTNVDPRIIYNEGINPNCASDSKEWKNYKYPCVVFAMNGYHNIWGQAKTKGAVVIDTSRLSNKWWYDPGLYIENHKDGKLAIVTDEKIPAEAIIGILCISDLSGMMRKFYNNGTDEEAQQYLDEVMIKNTEDWSNDCEAKMDYLYNKKMETVTENKKTMKDLIKKSLDEAYYASKIDYTADQMQSAVFDVFSDHFVKGDDIKVDGIVGIYTIGEKTGDKIDWSIVNFFDTNRTLKRKVINDIRGLSKMEFDGDIDKGLRIVLSDQSKLNTYLSTVWNTIRKGIMAELAFFNKISSVERYKGKVVYSGEPGTKKDKFSGVDMIINGSGAQIKNASRVYPVSKERNVYRVEIDGTKLFSYKGKSQVKFLVFYIEDEDKVYIFPNTQRGYRQDYDGTKNIFTFYSKPSEL